MDDPGLFDVERLIEHLYMGAREAGLSKDATIRQIKDELASVGENVSLARIKRNVERLSSTVGPTIGAAPTLADIADDVYTGPSRGQMDLDFGNRSGGSGSATGSAASKTARKAASKAAPKPDPRIFSKSELTALFGSGGAAGAGSAVKKTGLRALLGRAGSGALGLLGSPVGVAAGLGLTGYFLGDALGLWDKRTPDSDDLIDSRNAIRPVYDDAVERMLDEFAINAETGLLDYLESSDLPPDIIDLVEENERMNRLSGLPSLREMSATQPPQPPASLYELAVQAGLA